MIEFLRSIPGPAFLFLYVCLAVACVLVGKVMMGSDSTRSAPMPNLTRFDPVTISFLKGGWKEAVKTAVFDLLNKGLVEIEGEKDLASVKRIGLSEPDRLARLQTLKPVTRSVYDHVKMKLYTRNLFKLEEIRKDVERLSLYNYQELAQNRLVKNASEEKQGWLIFWVLMVILVVTGVSKFVLGISLGKPVFFLFMLMVFSFTLVPLMLKPWGRASWLGRKYLAELEKHFGWLRTRSAPEGIDPAYPVAIFGAAALTGTTMYDEFHAAFKKSSSGSACGGCSGGSGCSGGGGGCGGCGGCGG